MENMAANAAEETVTGVLSEDNATPQTVAAEDGNAAVRETEQPGGDVTRTQQFARRLDEMSRKRADEAIAAIGMVNPFTGKPVSNQRELRALKDMQEAEADGRDPQSAAELSELRIKLSDYQLREQEQTILANPSLAPLYEEFRDDVQNLLGMAAQDGVDLSIEAALKAIVAQNYDTIQTREAERIRKETLEHIGSQNLASPGSLGGSPAGNKTDYASMPSADFNKLVEAAKRGEMKSL